MVVPCHAQQLGTQRQSKPRHALMAARKLSKRACPPVCHMPPCAGRQQQQQQQQPERDASPCPKELATAGKRLLRSVIVQGAAIEEWMDVAGGK